MNKKDLMIILCAAFLLPVTSGVGAEDIPPPVREMLKELPGVKELERTAPIRVPHKMHRLIKDHYLGTVELDLTTREIVFTAPDRGSMGVDLFRKEKWEGMGFGVVHTKKRYRYRWGGTFKLIITHEEKFAIIYFREYEGRVTVQRLF